MSRRFLALTLVALAWLMLATATAAMARPPLLKAMWSQPLPGGASDMAVDRDLGVKIYQVTLSWSDIATRRPTHPANPRDSAYQWPASVTAAVASAPGYGMRVAIEIFGAPSWANGGYPPQWAPSRAQDFASFATAAARRYPSVQIWEIWGEPTRSHNFQPLVNAPPGARLTRAQAAAPRRYARMLDAAYVALKRVSSANLVVGGMSYTTGDISTVQWVENLRLPNGRPPRMDLYGHNPFSFREPKLGDPPSPNQQIDFSDLGRLHSLVNRYLGAPRHRSLRIFISEFTIPTAVDQEFNFYVPPDIAGQWVTEALAIASRWGFIYAFGWIHLEDTPGIAGGLLTADGALKPSASAFQRG
jgi:hypothetical protein